MMPPPPLPSWRTRLPPPHLLVLYACFFLSAASLTLPMTAFGYFLNNELKLSQEVLSRYYAVTFLPWSFKPLYSFVFNRFPILKSTRRVYIIVFSFGDALALFGTAVYAVDANSAFGYAMLRSICSSISDCAQDITMIDYIGEEALLVKADAAAEENDDDGDARTTTGSPPEANVRIQSQSNTARTLGSIFAYTLGFFMYGCDDSISSSMSNARNVIFATGLFPLTVAILSIFLREVSITPVPPPSLPSSPEEVEMAGSGAREEGNVNEEEERRSEQTTSSHSPSRFFLDSYVLALVFYVQFLVVWIGCQGLVSDDVWKGILVVTVAAGIFGVVTFKAKQRAKKRARIEVDFPERPPRLEEDPSEMADKSLFAVMMLFVMNALPSYSIPWFSFTYHALDNSQCGVHLLLVGGQLATLASCLAFPRLSRLFYRFRAAMKARRGRVRNDHVGLDDTSPMVLESHEEMRQHPSSDERENGIGMRGNDEASGQEDDPSSRPPADAHAVTSLMIFFNIFAVLFALLCAPVAASWVTLPSAPGLQVAFVLVTLATGFTGSTAFLSQQVFASERCFDVRGKVHPGFAYSVFISFLNLGDSASGWISAPIIGALNLDYVHWGGLWLLICITSLLDALVLVVFWVVLWNK